MPQYTQKIMSYFGKSIKESQLGKETKNGLDWSDLGKTNGLFEIGETSVYFTPMDQKTMLAFREKFAGNQSERKESKKTEKKQKKNEKKAAPVILPLEKQAEFFSKNIQLKVAKIVSVERNPDSDKLYIEHLDDGSGNDRVIQSGLVPYLKESELLGKHVIIADNLAPRKMRGIESRGMLLAADYKNSEGKDCVEPLSAEWAVPGTKVILEGDDVNAEKPAEITADDFFKISINVVNKNVEIAGKKLVAGGKIITTEFTENGGVN